MPVILNKMDLVPLEKQREVAKRARELVKGQKHEIPISFVDHDFGFEELRVPFIRLAEVLRDQVHARMKKGSPRRRLG